ncbi:hypothetical protein EOW77_0034640 [Bradyrhizobium yuanmingense]|nr:hypothetical protein EOW77_0034640 [Bradyrhizobium yuanmingense]
MAENIMIVELLRDDLSRVCAPHSVQVPALCHSDSDVSACRAYEAQTRIKQADVDVVRQHRHRLVDGLKRRCSTPGLDRRRMFGRRPLGQFVLVLLLFCVDLRRSTPHRGFRFIVCAVRCR